MFLKKIDKGPKGGKVYSYYRLCESIRIGGKTRHNNLLNLGPLDDLQPEELKMLANRIEELYIGCPNPMFSKISEHIDKLAVKFYQELREKHKVSLVVENNNIDKSLNKEIDSIDFEVINLKTLKHDDVREVGAEWLCLQAIKELDIEAALIRAGMEQEVVNKAIALIVSRAVYPASEYKTSQWLQSSSALSELVFGEHKHISTNSCTLPEIVYLRIRTCWNSICVPKPMNYLI